MGTADSGNRHLFVAGAGERYATVMLLSD